MNNCVLVHLASGIGNIVLATPLLIALSELDYEIDVLLHADYPEVEMLLKEWRIIRNVIDGNKKTLPRFNEYSALIPAIPPFYLQKYGHVFDGCENLITRPSDGLFYNNERSYYLEYAYKLGYPQSRNPQCYLPIQPSINVESGLNYIVLAPGSKTGEMSKKRWPYFPQLAEQFENVIVVGTQDDLYDCSEQKYKFPDSVCSYVGKLNLKETAEIIASAEVFVGNDNGLSHLSAAIGVETVIIFGPTPDKTLGYNNINIIRSGFSCEPCWFNNRQFRKCNKQIDCLNNITVNQVKELVNNIIIKNQNGN